MADIWHFITSIRAADIIDIAVVMALVYGLLAVLRETRSAAVMRGVVGLIVAGFALYALARGLNLSTTALLFERLWIVTAIAFLIFFEKDLRKAITETGQIRAFRRFFASGGRSIEETLKAVRAFSRQKIGALVCIERRDSLKIYADTGTTIDGLTSGELLRTIFVTYSPLHDGAVVLRGDRVVAAGCFLPLSANPTIERELGTRHRAGIGLSEETDAIVIIVSEETGTISLAVGGKIERHHTQETLREALQDLLDVDEERPETSRD